MSYETVERYISFSPDNYLVFIDNFHFLSSSLDSLVKNLSENAFKNLSLEFDSEVLDFVKEKEFYPYEHMSRFEKFNEILSTKNKCFRVRYVVKALITKSINMFSKFRINLKRKQ